MSRLELRNAGLYRRLCTVFGASNVGIHRPGQPGRRITAAAAALDRGYSGMQAAEQVGEEYNVPCPICGERRSGKSGRLWFNHLWGTKDPRTNSTILWLCHCYNEECQQEYRNRVKLAEMVLGGDTLVVKQIDVPIEPPKKAKWPGVMQSLIELAPQGLNHPAIRFCLRKGYDPRVLANKYGVMYCMEVVKANPLARHRLVVPFYVRIGGQVELAGWTARRLREPPRNASQEDLDSYGPKWLHSSTPTGHIVYGLSEASKYPTIAIGEGPGDRWALGEQSVATLGKTLRAAKIDRIAAALAEHGDAAKVVLVYDPMQDAKAKARGALHHILDAVARWKERSRIPVYDLWLPRWSDPGSLVKSYTWWHIEQRLKEPPA